MFRAEDPEDYSLSAGLKTAVACFHIRSVAPEGDCKILDPWQLPQFRLKKGPQQLVKLRGRKE